MEKSFPEKITSISWQSNRATVDTFNQLWENKVVANTTNYPVNVRWHYLSTDKIWNLFMNLYEPAPLGSVDAFRCSQLTVFIFPSIFHATTWCPFVCWKTNRGRERIRRTHTHTLIKIGGQVWLHLEDNHRKYMDTHHTSWQHRDIHQVLSLYSVFQKERLKYQVDHTWWYGDMTIICNLVPLRISRFMNNLWLSRWGVGEHTIWNKASLLQSEDKLHLS